MQKRIRNKKDPETRATEGTSQLLKSERPRGEGTSQLLKSERPRGEGAEAYKEQERPRSGSNSKNHKNIKNESI